MIGDSMRKMLNPEWFQKLPDDAKLDSNEIKQLFGYSKSTSIGNLVDKCYVPKPTHRCESRFYRRNNNNKLLWEVKYLRELLK